MLHQLLLLLLLWQLIFSSPVDAAITCTRNEADRKSDLRGNQTTYLGCTVDSEMLVDNANKILMDWTPKAACTHSINMFFEHMGIVHGRDYDDWPHTFRQKRFYKQCGRAMPNNFEEDGWFRFKMVRNPYIRVVSSYFHTMTHFSALYKQNASHADGYSFASYLQWLATHERVSMYDRSRGSHSTHQHREYEIVARARGAPSPYHQIIHIESAQQELAIMNYKLNQQIPNFVPFNFSTSKFEENLYGVDPTTDATEFMGMLPWRLIKHKHPQNFACMYNHNLRTQVERLYAWDLVLYNYTWPF